ncbi:MAG: sugar transferase [Bacteroidia bacterium]
MKRCFDFIVAFFALLFLLPVFLAVAIWIILDSKGSVFYFQQRVGQHGTDFTLFKFRTMRNGSDSKGLLTIGGRDPRITRSGYFLRKFKLDELPQLLNVLIGNMSLVGPRPEVRKYTSLYSPEQLQVLSVKPGITDYASIEYANENELLASADDPEAFYIQEVMPAKLKMNMDYIKERGFWTDMKVIYLTVRKIWT